MSAWRALLVALILCACHAGIATAQPATDAGPASLVVRARPSSDTKERLALLRALSEVAEPQRATLAAGQDVAELLRVRCGGARAEELTIFAELNPDVDMRGGNSDATVYVPPCVYWTGRTDVVVPPGSAVSDVLFMNMGASGPQTRRRVQALNPEVDLERVAGGQTITVPYATRPVALKLKPALAGEAKTIASRFQQMPMVHLAEATAELRVVRPVSLPVGADGLHPCQAIPQNLTWPFDADRLVTILRYNAAQRSASAQSAIAAVADTGIDRTETRLPLERTPDEGDDETEDGDGNGYNGDAIGVNLATSRGFPASDSRDSDAKHGTHVAGLVSGQVMTAALSRLAGELIKLKILNLKSRSVEANPQGGEPIARFSIPPDGVAHALQYASQQRATVLNLSIESGVPLNSFRSIMAEASMLTVAAAGNSSKDLDNENVYPAVYRRQRPEKFITVAAHDFTGKLAWFSNHGGETVDIAAPGVCINSFVPGGSEERLSGTSQAAPIVSLTAALLAVERLSPEAIKRRIITTVDIDPTLDVITHGRLNVLKAVACYDDQIEVEGRGWLRGRLDHQQALQVGAESVQIARLVRVLPHHDPSSTTPMKTFIRQANGELRIELSARPDTAISFEVIGAVRSESFPLERVVDVIPRTCRGPAH